MRIVMLPPDPPKKCSCAGHKKCSHRKREPLGAPHFAEVSKALEAKQHPAEEVAQFLMRCLFTMFAASVGLLPEESFRDLLDDCRKDPGKFVPLLKDLWTSMNEGEFAASTRLAFADRSAKRSITCCALGVGFTGNLAYSRIV
jgi:hypothetical protein